MLTAILAMRPGRRKSDQKPIRNRSAVERLGALPPGTRDKQELLFEEEILGNNRLCATGAKKFSDGGQQVDKQNEYVLHTEGG